MSEQAQNLWLCEPPRDMSPKESAGYYRAAAEDLKHLIAVAERGPEPLFVVLVDAKARCLKHIRMVEEANKESRAEKLRAELLELEGAPEQSVGPSAALALANNALSDAHDVLEGVEPAVLGGEPYWEARQAISRAGEIVAGGQRPSKRKAPAEDEGADTPDTPLTDADELLAAASDLLGGSAPDTEEADKVEREVRRLVLEARRALRSERRREAGKHESVEPESGGRAASA